MYILGNEYMGSDIRLFVPAYTMHQLTLNGDDLNFFHIPDLPIETKMDYRVSIIGKTSILIDPGIDLDSSEAKRMFLKRHREFQT